MTVDDLAHHLDKRLDKQDAERAAMSRDIGKLQVAMGRSQTAADNAKDACRARHESNKGRISRMERGVIGLGAAALAACVKFVWDAATGKAGA